MALSRYSLVVGHIKCTAASQGCRLDHSKAGTCGGRLPSLPDTALVKYLLCLVLRNTVLTTAHPSEGA